MTKTHCNICDEVMYNKVIKLELPNENDRYHNHEFAIIPVYENGNGVPDICKACIIKAMRFKRIIPANESNQPEVQNC